jgi:hypothetical protein
MTDSLIPQLQKFVEYCQQYIRGDEKGEAQVFLDRLFRAFGHEGAIEAGATYEQRIEKGSKKQKTGFADLVWKPRVLIEMKKRGTNLDKHYPQAFQYWTRLVPDRPRYVLLCNFDEFWIYDFNLQVDTPVDMVALVDLPQRASAFRFLEITNYQPIFNNNQVEVTALAARRMGDLCHMLMERGKKTGDFDDLTAQRFVLQCVLAMFSEDRKLLPDDMFVTCVQRCLDGETSTYDELTQLFTAMNRQGIEKAGKFKGVDYFNGGLFAKIHPIELTQKELEILDVTAKQDWSKVRPAIFGNIFEGTANDKERHATGMHFTSEVDIMKIVRPTISEFWEEKIEAANTLKELNGLVQELREYKVLDPACGSGNFLYIAYQELKRIEVLLLEKIAQVSTKDNEQAQFGIVTPLQFFGMDINPFGIELARVTMMIARKVAIDRFELTEPALPLDTLDQNIIRRNALLVEWEKTDAIIGNPPFLGGKRLRMTLGDKKVDKIVARFPDVKDSVDFCCYWFRLAHENLSENGRAGLVGTNSISQGKSRRASLDYILQNGGTIYNAVSTQVWSGEANVHVSIVNWHKQQTSKFMLDGQPVSNINSSLGMKTDVTLAEKIKQNSNIGFQGVIPVGKDFYISEEQAQEWIRKNKKNSNVLKSSLSAGDLADKPNAFPSRWIIDFNDIDLEEASSYKQPFAHLKINVKPQRDENRREVTRVNWWKYGEKRPAMRQEMFLLSCYFAVPSHSKWFVFLPCDLQWLPNNSTAVITSEDFYVLGLLTSNVHREWVKAQSSTLEDRTRYTHNTCFETFPFPQLDGSQKIIKDIRAAMQKLHDYRTEQMENKQWGITKLYNEFFHEPASQLYKLHKKLDSLVMQAYGFNTDDDLLAKLLELNLELAEREEQGLPVIGARDFKYFPPKPPTTTQ